MLCLVGFGRWSRGACFPTCFGVCRVFETLDVLFVVLRVTVGVPCMCRLGARMAAVERVFAIGEFFGRSRG